MPSWPLPRKLDLPPLLARVYAHQSPCSSGAGLSPAHPQGQEQRGTPQVSVKCPKGSQSLLLPGSGSHPSTENGLRE